MSIDEKKLKLSSYFRSNLLKSESAATMMEYALLAALIAVVCISAISFAGIEARKTTRMVACCICAAQDPPVAWIPLPVPERVRRCGVRINNDSPPFKCDPTGPI